MAVTPNAGKYKIMIIEDDPFLLSMYVTKMEMVGYKIAQAADGREGLETIKKEQPDLILLDILLPTMDGFEVLAELQADEALKKIPVILLTNLGQKEDIEKGLQMGASDYLIKAHFTPQEVMEKIEGILGNGDAAPAV